MARPLSPQQSPEQQVLDGFKEELRGLSEQLAERELQLANLQRELADFERAYLSTVGRKQAELDAIEAEIARILAKASPHDKGLKTNAKGWSQRARESAKATGGALDVSRERKVAPSPEVRELYLAAAKQIHPDLAFTDEGRRLRERLMAEINDARDKGDANRIKAILAEWQFAPEQVVGEDVASQIVRVVRQISQVRSRIAKVEAELDRLSNAALAVLKVKVDKAASEGRDLLEELGRAVDAQIRSAVIRLEALRANPRNG